MLKSKLPIFSINSLARRNTLLELRKNYCPCVDCSSAFSAFTSPFDTYLPLPGQYVPFCRCDNCSSSRHTLLSHYTLYQKVSKLPNTVQYYTSF